MSEWRQLKLSVLLHAIDNNHRFILLQYVTGDKDQTFDRRRLQPTLEIRLSAFHCFTPFRGGLQISVQSISGILPVTI